MIADAYLPLLLLGVGLGALTLFLARRAADPGSGGSPLVRVRDPGSQGEASTRAAIRVLLIVGGLAVLVLAAFPVIGQLGSPRCEAPSGAHPCRDGDPLSPIPLLPGLLASLPLMILGWRELRAL